MLFIVTATLDHHLEGVLTYTYPTMQTQVTVILATRISFLKDMRAHPLPELINLS